MIRIFKNSIPQTSINIIIILNQYVVESFNIGVIILVRKYCFLLIL